MGGVLIQFGSDKLDQLEEEFPRLNINLKVTTHMKLCIQCHETKHSYEPLTFCN